MRAYKTLIALTLLLGCTATKTVPTPVQYRLIDLPDEGRIELIFRNETSKALCISADYWPNAAGRLNQMSERVFLVVNGNRFPIEHFNTGYCIGDVCATRVAPGEQISSSISYKDFDLPEILWPRPKTLEFSPQAYTCR